MSNMKDEVVIKFYVSRFGRPDSKGICYMTQILKQAIAKELTHDTPRYDHLVAKVAKENGVAPASILRSIGRYVSDRWDPSYRRNWELYTGWNQAKPPGAAKAIRLLCESYPFFCAWWSWRSFEV